MLSILTNQSSIFGKSLSDISSEKWTASPSRETTFPESGSGHRLVEMPGNLLANSWFGSSEPDDAEEIWDQASNFGLESSNDVVTGNFGYQYTRLFASRQTMYLCYKCSRPLERFLNAWLDSNDGPVSRLISFPSPLRTSTCQTLLHGKHTKVLHESDEFPSFPPFDFKARAESNDLPGRSFSSGHTKLQETVSSSFNHSFKHSHTLVLVQKHLLRFVASTLTLMLHDTS